MGKPKNKLNPERQRTRFSKAFTLEKLIQPLPEDQVSEPSMKHKLAIWYSKQLPKDHPLLK